MKNYEKLYDELINGKVPTLTKKQAIILSMYTSCSFINKFVLDIQSNFVGENFLNGLEFLNLEDSYQAIKSECQRKMTKSIRKIISELNPKTAIFLSSITCISFYNISEVKAFEDLVPWEEPNENISFLEFHKRIHEHVVTFFQDTINKMVVDVTEEDIKEIIKEIIEFEEK